MLGTGSGLVRGTRDMITEQIENTLLGIKFRRKSTHIPGRIRCPFVADRK